MINFEVALRKKDPNGKALLLKVRTRGSQRAEGRGACAEGMGRGHGGRWAEGMEGANGRLGC